MYPRLDDVSLFQRYINDNKLEEKGIPLHELTPLEGLNKVMLGVDGTKIVDIITQAVREKERMAIYTYTTPYTVYEKVDEIRTMLRSLKNCTPVLVFNGIQYSPDPAEELSREKNMVPVEVAKLVGTDSSRVDKSNIRFLDIQKKAAARFVVEEDVEGQIIRILRHEFKNTIRAPYLAWAQLSSFRHGSNRHVSEVYGCLELLAFPGIDRVVTNINTANGTFDVVHKSRVLGSLRLSEEDLASLILLDSRSRVMKPVALKFSSLEDMCEKIVRYKGSTLGASYAQHLHDEVSRGVADMNRAPINNQKSAAFRNLSALASPVLTLTPPFCIPLHALYEIHGLIPLDVQVFLGFPLPSVLYYLISAGLLSPSLFAAVSQEAVVDDWPLVDSIKYRDVAETVLPLRVQTIYQLAWVLRRSLGSISWFRRYNVRQSRVNKLHIPPAIQLDNWALNGLNVPNGLHLVDVMEYAHLACSADVVYETVGETHAAVLLQSLDLLGYLTHETQEQHGEGQSSEPSTFGRALQLCSVPTLSEYTVLLIELVRTSAITTEPIRMTPDAVSPRDTPCDVIFASRVLSIIPLNVAGPWTAPVDAELAAFSMLSRMISRSIRQLLEAITTLMFCKGRTAVPLHMIGEIQQGLPFSTPVEFGSGVLVEYMLMKDKCTLKDLEDAFPECTYLRHDLATLFYFWDLAVQVLHRIETKENFCVDPTCLVSANERMKKAQKNLNIHTGMRETYY